jgi:hypothetical protein
MTSRRFSRPAVTGFAAGAACHVRFRRDAAIESGRGVANDPKRLSAVQTFRVAKSLFDNLVGADQQRFWDGETDRLGGL